MNAAGQRYKQNRVQQVRGFCYAAATGSVSKAEVVDDPRRGADPAYRSLAISARNAALLSSPLKLPEGSYETVKDIVLTLDPREVRR